MGFCLIRIKLHLYVIPPAKQILHIQYQVPSTVVYISNFAFCDCEYLTEIIIPGRVSSIGKSAFRGCTNLSNITLSNNLASISRSMFYGCTSLTDVYYNGTITEWNNISVNSGNNCLLNAKNILL